MATPNSSNYLEVNYDKYFDNPCDINIGAPSYDELLNAIHEFYNDTTSLCFKILSLK